ncbi:MAG: winged helix-turn-helix transcriptional regulator [Rothia mucilaginosa]|uniref:ArsR/SmtB family transcription factor n=1 Tax=Rothia mucilaginosa TaxID=43675 RepID=UPI001CB2D6CE|nr:metalloregulator ArsR/SmtB family transcription factor [Rothia mucilaginosa]MBF1651507.1 winged helix-turn-helix transcriptional regulator [Rothia mucilaginosa]
MTQSHHADQNETNTTHNHAAEHVAAHVADHAHEAPANAPLLEGSGPKDWEEQFGPSVAIFSALANPLRLAIAHHLMHRPHSVSELHTCLGISQPLASHHLRILREAHVIDREQQGRTTIYRLKDDHISHIVVDVYEHTREHHAD